MPRPKPRRSQRGTIWHSLLSNSIPVFSKGLQWLAVNRMAKFLQAGDREAVHGLVEGLNEPRCASVHEDILAALAGPLAPACLDQLWEEWAACRIPALEELLRRGGQPAGRWSSSRVISLALLQRGEDLQDISAAQIPEIARLLADPNPGIAAVGCEALGRLKSQGAIDAAFQVWADTRADTLWQILARSGCAPRQPVAVLALYALKQGLLEDLRQAPPEWVPGLAAALRDKDPAVSAQARACLPFLQSSASIDALCALWSQSRAAALGRVLKQGRLIASQPVELRLLTALEVGQLEPARQANPAGLPLLVPLLADADPEVAAACRQALLSLVEPETRAALCRLAVDLPNDALLQLALEAGYRPPRPDDLAVFLFMAGQWAEYEALDFDRRLMAAIYAAGRPELRRRILQQVQRSGRQADISILEGQEFRSSAYRLPDPELELLVGLLVRSQEWQRCWALVGELAFSWGVRLLKALAGSGWQPQDELDCQDFVRLCALARDFEPPTPEAFSSAVPPAIRSASLRVQGRVNAVCFAPQRPLLAIGTGARRLVQWNFQTAAVEKVYRGLNHSIAELAYVGGDTLVCGVRSNTSAACLIYGWSPTDAFVLPGHTGAVTALEAAGPAGLLSTGRDGAAILWDLAGRAELARRDLPDWPRAARISPDGRRLALLDGSLSLLQLPALTPIDLGPLRTVRHSGTAHSVGQCAVFTPDGKDVLVGQRNGQLVRYQFQERQPGLTRQAIAAHPAAIVALEFLPDRPVLVTALAAGQVHFSAWPAAGLPGSVSTPGQRITSLHISPDGSFMATGAGDSGMVLWDLRAAQLPALYATPLARVSPEGHSLVSALLRCPGLPGPLRPALHLLHALLVHRFRFDIQIAELPQIQPGEFDILLE